MGKEVADFGEHYARRALAARRAWAEILPEDNELFDRLKQRGLSVLSVIPDTVEDLSELQAPDEEYVDTDAEAKVIELHAKRPLA